MPHVHSTTFFYSIGTFGQESAWDLGVSTTYQHPMKTRDLLFHTATGSTLPAPYDDEPLDRTADKEDASSPQVSPRKTPAVQVRPELSVTEMEDEVCASYMLYKWCLYIPHFQVEDMLQPYSICLDVPRYLITIGTE